MKAAILAERFGTRLSEEIIIKSKPMVKTGGQPILWHVLKIYAAYSINDFIIYCGYKGYLIKKYFATYFLHVSEVTFDIRFNQMHIYCGYAEPWRVTWSRIGDYRKRWHYWPFHWHGFR